MELQKATLLLYTLKTTILEFLLLYIIEFSGNGWYVVVVDNIVIIIFIIL